MSQLDCLSFMVLCLTMIARYMFIWQLSFTLALLVNIFCAMLKKRNGKIHLSNIPLLLLILYHSIPYIYIHPRVQHFLIPRFLPYGWGVQLWSFFIFLFSMGGAFFCAIYPIIWGGYLFFLCLVQYHVHFLFIFWCESCSAFPFFSLLHCSFYS